MKLFKLTKKYFTNIPSNSHKFSKIPKDEICYKRLSQISLLEYLNIIPRKTKSPSYESLIKEILLYLQSKDFTKEFQYTLTNENRLVY